MPELRCYLNMLSLDDLSVPRSLEDIHASGYAGVQWTEPLAPDARRECERLGLGWCTSGRVNSPQDARDLSERCLDEGAECATLHVGWGMEDDDEAARLIEAILESSERVPLYVETHRATLFQDLWRTVGFVRRYPDLRFNGDFSHWYTGLEMVYGGFEQKLAFIQPVLDRVRFVHGRIGSPGSIQVDVGEGRVSEDRPYLAHFRTLWTRSFEGFLRAAHPDDHILFVPELLSPRIFYGRTFRGQEECDRWRQSLVLRRIAAECFEAARSATIAVSH